MGSKAWRGSLPFQGLRHVPYFRFSGILYETNIGISDTTQLQSRWNLTAPTQLVLASTRWMQLRQIDLFQPSKFSSLRLSTRLHPVLLKANTSHHKLSHPGSASRPTTYHIIVRKATRLSYTQFTDTKRNLKGKKAH